MKEKLKEIWNDPKKKKSFIKETVIIGIIIIVTFSFIPMLKLFLGTKYPLVVVTSGSMEPTISRGDLLVIKGMDPEDIEVGDHLARNGSILLYDATGLDTWTSFNPEEPIVHRCVYKYYNETEQKYYFNTWGDNVISNTEPDSKSRLVEDPCIPEDKIIGVVSVIIPAVGHIKLFFSEGNNSIYVTILIIGLAIYLTLSIIKDLMNPEDEEEEKQKEKNQKVESLADDSDKNIDLGV